jgi:hypothetical protein
MLCAMTKTLIGRKQLLQLGLVGIGAHTLALLGCSDDETTNGSGGSGATGAGGAGAAGGGGGDGGSAGDGGQGQGGEGGQGGGSGGSGGGGDACAAMIVAQISLNHAQPHTLEIPLADIIAGVDATYDTGGPSGHCHRVTITAADFTTLKNGGSVTVFSCNGGDHEYVLSCAPGAPAPGDPMCDINDQTGACA